MNDEERNEYFKYLKDVVYSQDVLTAAREEGEAKGKAEEREKSLQREMAKIEQIALDMIRDNVDAKLICKYTGISSDELAKLKQKHKP